ncbi:MAG: chromate transporter [Stellaceae bacterium]
MPEGERLASAGKALEVLGAFLKLGCSSFGSPVAHLGYVRAEFVGKRGWLDEAAYADILYRPVWTSAIFAAPDFMLGLVAFLLLAFWRVPPWLVVILGALGAEGIARLA